MSAVDEHRECPAVAAVFVGSRTFPAVQVVGGKGPADSGIRSFGGARVSVGELEVSFLVVLIFPGVDISPLPSCRLRHRSCTPI